MSRRYQGEGREKHSKVKEQLYEGQGHATALLLRETLSGEAEIHEVCEGAVGKWTKRDEQRAGIEEFMLLVAKKKNVNSILKCMENA